MKKIVRGIVKCIIGTLCVILLCGLYMFYCYRNGEIRENYHIANLSEDLRAFYLAYWATTDESMVFAPAFGEMRLFLNKYPNVIGFCDFSTPSTSTDHLVVAILPSPRHPYVGVVHASGHRNAARLGSERYYAL